jgi:hypothetical protein
MSKSNGWGGYREGAGRKPVAEKKPPVSKVVRVPLSKLAQVEALLEGATVNVNRQPSEAETLLAVRELAGRWAEAVQGRETQPRWAHASRLLLELQAALCQVEDLRAFSLSVLNACRHVRGLGYASDFWGDDKVFISSAWREMCGSGAGLSLEEFKARLVEAAQAGLLRLSRSDLSAAMPADMLVSSETKNGAAVWHFIVL